ncbi:hypothetical protein V5799_030528 [Amblyomma americanum]|uniref:Uncharacterized protein n=1 Tax=Amblyomma americanum TaxID=6943 RepID=A0AAQ4ENT2_AMBAM
MDANSTSGMDRSETGLAFQGLGPSVVMVENTPPQRPPLKFHVSLVPTVGPLIFVPPVMISLKMQPVVEGVAGVSRDPKTVSTGIQTDDTHKTAEPFHVDYAGEPMEIDEACELADVEERMEVDDEYVS